MATDPPSRRQAWRDVLANWVLPHSWNVAWLPRAQQDELSHQQTYDDKFYEFVEESATWSRDAMADSIVRDLAPRNVLDIGCGTGTLLEAFRLRNVQVDGLEYSDAGIAVCRQRELLVNKFDIGRDRLTTRLRNRDVVISFEVAEHLPPELADRYVKLLTTASDTIVMSAATPGQGGTNHFNEQPNEYWIRKMAKRGYSIDWGLSMKWRTEWQGKTATWYHENVLVFRRARKRAQAA